MIALTSIQEFVQAAADAIAAAIGVEVTVIDKHFKRVVETGRCSNGGAAELVEGCATDRAVKSGRGMIIEEPGKDAVCLVCPKASTCTERSIILWPITLHKGTSAEQGIGVIGLVAWNEEQRARLCDKRDSLLNFIGRMADLIAAKAAEQEALTALHQLTHKLQVVINSVGEGIVSVDGDGVINLFNTSAEKILGIPARKALGQPVELLIPGSPIPTVLRTGRGVFSEDFMHVTNSPSKPKRLHLRCTAVPVLVEHSVVGVVASFEDAKEVHKFVSRVSSVKEMTTFDDIYTGDAAFRELLDRVRKVAQTPSTVLITGETGTGKGLLAQAIHSASPRRDAPFIAVNCAAIPETLLESELFGYEEGAFTGARRGGKPGKFELASGGTLFLDEVGDMSLHMQAKLLKSIEERYIERVGGIEPVHVDVRLVAATSKPIEEMVDRGEFRADLYYRLNVVPVALPPLRQRAGDIELLANHFVGKYARLLDKDVEGFTPEAMGILLRYTWPGNIRELQNATEYAVNMETGRLIQVKSLPKSLRERGYETCKAQDRIPTLAEAERELLTRSIKLFGLSTQGKEMAAKALGIGRSTLYRKLKELGILESEDVNFSG